MIYLYALGYVVSVALAIGWITADFESSLSTPLSHRYSLGFATAISLLFMGAWPITLPLVYCSTGFAAAGWRLRFHQRPK